jgi:hypothetical protein
MSLSGVRQSGVPVVDFISRIICSDFPKIANMGLIIEICILVGFGLCLCVLAALLAGVFHYYGMVRVYCLYISIALSVTLFVGSALAIYRCSICKEKYGLLIVLGIITLLPVIEYSYFIRKQDGLIVSVISSIESNINSFELLSNIPDADAIHILSDHGIKKELCGTSYLYGVFYLCASDVNRKVFFMVDISPAPGVTRSIRVFEDNLK